MIDRRQTANEMRLMLYQRDDCHLCDLALAELAQASIPDFESVFIDEEPELEQRYGARVPVLVDPVNERELEWPFTAVVAREWLGLNGQPVREPATD